MAVTRCVGAVVMRMVSSCLLASALLARRIVLYHLVPELSQKPIAVCALSFALHLNHEHARSGATNTTSLADHADLAVGADEIFPDTDGDTASCHALKAGLG